MNNYLNSVMITVVVCQIVQMIAPESDRLKRGIRLLCALAVLLTVLAPVKYLMTNYDRISEMAKAWMDNESSVEACENPMESVAQAVMEHASQLCGLEADGMKVTLVTADESEELTEIQMFVKRCTYAQRESAAERLTEIYGIPVRIYNMQE